MLAPVAKPMKPPYIIFYCRVLNLPLAFRIYTLDTSISPTAAKTPTISYDSNGIVYVCTRSVQFLITRFIIEEV